MNLSFQHVFTVYMFLHRLLFCVVYFLFLLLSRKTPSSGSSVDVVFQIPGKPGRGGASFSFVFLLKTAASRGWAFFISAQSPQKMARESGQANNLLLPQNSDTNHGCKHGAWPPNSDNNQGTMIRARFRHAFLETSRVVLIGYLNCL